MQFEQTKSIRHAFSGFQVVREELRYVHLKTKLAVSIVNEKLPKLTVVC